jgi:hypothetical protein
MQAKSLNLDTQITAKVLGKFLEGKQKDFSFIKIILVPLLISIDLVCELTKTYASLI